MKRLEKFSSLYLTGNKNKISETHYTRTLDISDDELSDPNLKAKFVIDKLPNGKFTKEQLTDELFSIVIDNSIWYAKNPRKETESFAGAVFKASNGEITDENRDILTDALSKEFVKWDKMTNQSGGITEAVNKFSDEGVKNLSEFELENIASKPQDYGRLISDRARKELESRGVLIISESAIGTKNFFEQLGQTSVKFATFANNSGITSGELGNIYFSDLDNVLSLYFKDNTNFQKALDKIGSVIEGTDAEITGSDNSTIQVSNIKSFENAKKELVESKMTYSMNTKSDTRNKLISFIAGGQNGRRSMDEYLTFINSVEEDKTAIKKINRNYVNQNSHLFRKMDIGNTTYIGLTKIGKKYLLELNESANENTRDSVINGLNDVLSPLSPSFYYDADGLYKSEITNLKEANFTIDEIGNLLEELSETFGGYLTLEELDTDGDDTGKNTISIKYANKSLITEE